MLLKEYQKYYWLIDSDNFQWRLKRFGDITVSLFLLILSSPLIVIFAFLIWIEDRGPIFYSQIRTGLNGKEFNSENTYLFFDTMKDEDGRYLSEDYAFSRRWQKIGGKIYADIGSSLSHVGQYRYTGQLWKHFNIEQK